MYNCFRNVNNPIHKQIHNYKQNHCTMLKCVEKIQEKTQEKMNSIVKFLIYGWMVWAKSIDTDQTMPPLGAV